MPPIFDGMHTDRAAGVPRDHRHRRGNHDVDGDGDHPGGHRAARRRPPRAADRRCPPGLGSSRAPGDCAALVAAITTAHGKPREPTTMTYGTLIHSLV